MAAVRGLPPPAPAPPSAPDPGPARWRGGGSYPGRGNRGSGGRGPASALSTPAPAPRHGQHGTGPRAGLGRGWCRARRGERRSGGRGRLSHVCVRHRQTASACMHACGRRGRVRPVCEIRVYWCAHVCVGSGGGGGLVRPACVLCVCVFVWGRRNSLSSVCVHVGDKCMHVFSCGEEIVCCVCACMRVSRKGRIVHPICVRVLCGRKTSASCVCAHVWKEK